MDDLHAVRQCKAGDRESFRYLVERYQAEAIGHAIAILADREDAMDAVQDAFLNPSGLWTILMNRGSSIHGSMYFSDTVATESLLRVERGRQMGKT